MKEDHIIRFMQVLAMLVVTVLVLTWAFHGVRANTNSWNERAACQAAGRQILTPNGGLAASRGCYKSSITLTPIAIEPYRQQGTQ